MCGAYGQNCCLVVGLSKAGAGGGVMVYEREEGTRRAG